MKTHILNHEYNSQEMQRWLRAVEGSCDGLWEWDIRTDRAWFAPRFLEMLGYSYEEFHLGVASWRKCLHPEDRYEACNAIVRHLKLNERYDTRYRLETKGGDYRWFRSRGMVFRDDRGRPICMAGSIQDIDVYLRTAQMLREKESQLLQKQKMDAVGSLTAGIAHEFNNLLQAIRGYTTFAQEALEPDSQPYQDLQCVQTASERASHLTRQLLDFSRAEATKNRTCIADEIVRDLAHLLRPLLPEHIDFQLRFGPEAALVWLDLQHAQQALLNLCINARDAMPTGGQLLVRTEVVTVSELTAAGYANLTPGRYVRFWITDNGKGISPESQHQIFEPFYTTKEVGKGTGLGLSMTFGVVQHAGGHIDVYSRVGEGSSFRIYLPTLEEETVSDTKQFTARTGRGEKVLLAEDDALVCELGRRMLEKAGYQVITAGDGREALELCRSQADKLDLIILDIVMPSLTGREVLEELRRQEIGVPICFCTGYDPAASHSDSLRSLGCAVVAKPFNEEHLIETVRTVLEEKAVIDHSAANESPQQLVFSETDQVAAGAQVH